MFLFSYFSSWFPWLDTENLCNYVWSPVLKISFPSPQTPHAARSVMSNSLWPWTTAHQAPLSMRFPRQEYWSGLSFPSPGDLPIPGIKPVTPESSEWVGRFFTTAPPGKPLYPSSLTEQSKLEHFTHPGLCREAPQEPRKALGLDLLLLLLSRFSRVQLCATT